MSRFNLIKEPWILVIRISDGVQTEVSIEDLFRNAAAYRGLAGEMETQNFAVLRMLLAILQTAFSRYDAAGNALVPVDEKMRQTEEIEDDEEEQEGYADAVNAAWEEIWEAKKFPEILFEYLEVWSDRFYLFDETYPFYQVTQKTLEEMLPLLKRGKPSVERGRFLNKTIAEGGHTQALFSPKNDGDGNNKDVLTDAELARWLLMFHGYTSVKDKSDFMNRDGSPSKGWLYGLGGLYLGGKTLFETLLLNEIPVHSEKRFRFYRQRPCWEYSGRDVVQRIRAGEPIKNLSELYTNWSRVVSLDSEREMPSPVQIQIIKLPEIPCANQFLEPMTMWRFNEDGNNKGLYTPRKHRPEQAMWRSFGLIALPSSDDAMRQQPGILTRLTSIREVIGDELITLQAVSMKDDGDPKSRMPKDEIEDQLQIDDLVLTDEADSGWLIRINDEIEETKGIIGKTYRGFLQNVALIRNLGKGTDAFVSKGTENLYQTVDRPFRNWLAGIRPDDSKEERIAEWRSTLRKLALHQAEGFLKQAVPRDYTGIEKDDRTMNIVTAYLSFKGNVNRKLGGR